MVRTHTLDPTPDAPRPQLLVTIQWLIKDTNFYPDAHHQTGRMRLGGKYDNADFLDLRMRGDDTRREDFKLSIS